MNQHETIAAFAEEVSFLLQAETALRRQKAVELAKAVVELAKALDCDRNRDCDADLSRCYTEGCANPLALDRPQGVIYCDNCMTLTLNNRE